MTAGSGTSSRFPTGCGTTRSSSSVGPRCVPAPPTARRTRSVTRCRGTSRSRSSTRSTGCSRSSPAATSSPSGTRAMAAPVPPSPAIPRPTTVTDLPLAIRVAVVAAVGAVATVIIAILEQTVGVADASPLYLIPVVLAAALLGTWGAVAASIVAFLIYDFAFTTPRFTFEVSDPAEWLNLLLFLFVAVVLGRLTTLFRDRADEADRRAREAGALVAISRDIATAGSFEEAAQAVADRLRHDAEMEAVWVTVATRPGILVASSGPVGAATSETAGMPWTLVRATPDGASDWLRLHDDDAGGRDSAT